MPDRSKNILLISYVFPPYYGIGGRRWAKHANGLTKLGYTVHVICAKNPFKKTSLWYDIVKNNPNIILHQLPAWYPKVLVNFEHNFFQKIIYKFWITVLPFFTKGSFLDRTIFWKRPMLKKATSIIRDNKITHVICTGGPFGVMRFSTMLKQKFGNLFIINDLRDPWTWGPNWGFPSLSKKRMAHEQNMERETMEESDIISVPSDDMRDFLRSKYPNCSHKFIRIPHFFDPEELKLNIQPKKETKNVRFIMYGNIYHNIEPYINKTIELFAKYKGHTSLDVYTDKFQYEKYFKQAGADNVNFYNQIPAKELFNKFSEYDFVFLLNPNYNKDNISTKFYEIIYTKTPIFIFCDDGLGPKFLVENNLGIHSDLSNIDKKFHDVINKRTNFIFNDNYNINEYSIDNVINIIDQKLHTTPVITKDSKLKNLLITFDYELFLGSKSGTAKNCIIEPTNSILDLLNKYNIKKSLFFVDTVYLMRLVGVTDDESAKDDYRLIFDQLIQVLKNGHFIFPHIHPHWLSATYNRESKQWTLKDLEKYRFHNITNEEREQLFKSSIDFIKEIQKSANVFYEIDSYRAGGWCIQPFADFKPFFEKYNIKYDFSVLSNFKLLNDKFFYNFVNFPKEKIYRFNSEIENTDENGKFTEFSITNVTYSNKEKVRSKLFLKVLYKLNYHSFGDGLAVIKPEEEETIMSDSFISNSNENIEMTSIELLTMPKLKIYKNYTRNNSYIHFITHPKMLDKHNIFCFEKYLKFLLKNFKTETDYKQILKNVEAK
ncbi:MAG: hypothetical protein JNJ40_07915 [Bacteroidia bacterium]|nr:hypothetical protein [Bacteroidia bacterium]